MFSVFAILILRFQQNMINIWNSTYIGPAFHSDQLMRNPDGGGEVNIQLHLDQSVFKSANVIIRKRLTKVFFFTNPDDQHNILI
jgi:hypothetical protein